MKIWVIGRGYPTTSNGMWGSFELEQAKLLGRNGHEVCYIALTLSFFNRKDPRGFREFKEDGVRIFTYSHLYFPGKVGIYLEKFEDKCWRILLDRAKSNSGMPELIHVHYPSMLSSINEIEKYRSAGVRIYVTEHWSRVLVNNLKRHELKRLQYYGKCSNCFLSVSQKLLDAASDLTEITVPKAIVPNLVSPVFEKMEGGKEDKGFTFIAVGRLVPLKQFDIIIRQFMGAFSGKGDVKLKIIGSGDAKAALEKMAGDCPQIQFTGMLKQADVAKEISKADALISYSKYETFCVPVAEAWLCGKPVIISDRVGISYYLSDWLGVEVPFDAPEELGKAMIGMVDGYEKYNAEKISEYAKKMFTEDVVYQKLIAVYEKY